MELELLSFFSRIPGTLPLYQALAQRMAAELPPFHTRVQKTQISFSNKHGFAYVSLPLRRIKNCPQASIIVTFGLMYRLYSPRIFQAVEPYPMRWTHHVIVSDPEEINDELMGWIRESYHFSMSK